ncbi:MAG: hypothetical protein CL904_06870 [Dehalococcoidia bacterium]|mgnify:CR=1 FL=1|nr:hypothetical protein [Dehalococcoidia bacterium]MQG16151.1 rhodanese-related sulfurtransferase [SAR202 cluster bacterium]|tara:strand:+ start:27324 stop:28268 length:945 start_codon:yes stop_codon:yes gene_type:complete
MIQFKVAAFYEFIKVSDLSSLSQSLKSLCTQNKIRGSIIIASEGINGTIAGLPDFTDEFIGYLDNMGFHNLNIKFSQTPNMPFYRSKVKIKKEIVTFSNNPVNNEVDRAQHISPKDWNDFVSQKDVIIVDVRNDYETKIGSFKSSVSPDTRSFVEFKDYIDTELSSNKDQKIAMYCTGGIRCEKASYYMKEIGFNNLFQLDGGILKYLEEVDEEDSLWDGECYVFDNRVSLNKGLQPGIYDLCHGCNEPVAPKDKKSKKYEEDVSCPQCYDNMTEDKKNRSRERSKQIKLSAQRGTSNVYLPKTAEDYIKEFNL